MSVSVKTFYGRLKITAPSFPMCNSVCDLTVTKNNCAVLLIKTQIKLFPTLFHELTKYDKVISKYS